MLTSEIAIEIIRTISVLPPDKVDEVRDFANFLKERYGTATAIEYGEAWTDEDITDLTTAALNHAAQTVWAEEKRNG